MKEPFKVIWAGPIDKNGHQEIIFALHPKATNRQAVKAFMRWVTKNRPKSKR